jgi:flavin reductase (DIM6/NTAB) family NADH-FMN oxidoreductase RutF/DNA-binding IclR family transcriptional regulator
MDVTNRDEKPSPRFDARELRNVLGAFVTGVTVITTLDRDGRPHGLTANSFSSVSLDPPLVLWSQSLEAPSYPVFRDAERFAISILAEHQSHIAQHFARGGDKKFAGVEIEPGLSGLPLISGAAAYLECRRVANYPGGDHAVFMGEVDHIAHAPHRLLAFGRGRYLVTSAHDLGDLPPDLDMSGPAHLRSLQLARALTADLAAKLQETVAVAVWGNMGPTVVHWEESPRPVSHNLRTGIVLPVLNSATGLTFGAFLPEEFTEEAIRRELAGMNAPVRSLAEVRAIFERTRQAGAGAVGGVPDEFDGMYEKPINAVSVPVFDRAGKMVLALTVVGPGERLDISPEGGVAAALSEAASTLAGKFSSKR